MPNVFEIITCMRKVLCLFVLSICISFVSAQNVEQNYSIMTKIKESGNYRFAEFSSDSLDKARDGAVMELGSQIMTYVKSSSTINVYDGKLLYEQVSSTFTNVKLADYQTLVVAMPDKRNKFYTVFVYISNKRVDEILNEIKEQEMEELKKREQKLLDDVRYYYSEGSKAVKDFRIGDALKYYYWSYALSLGTQATISYYDPEDDRNHEESASRICESRIEQVLNNIHVTPVSYETVQINEFQQKYVLVVNVEYTNGKETRKVTNLDFEYNDGNTKQRGPRIRDGVGVMDLQYDMDKVRFQCVYKYDSNETPPDVYEIIKDKENKKFEAATKVIQIPKTLKDNPAKANSLASEISEGEKSVESAAPAARNHDEMKHRMDLIVNAINTKNYESVKEYFTDEAYDSFKKLIKTGSATIVRVPDEFRFLDFGDLTLCRSVTMQFRFRNNKQFIENVTFRFNEGNTVQSLAFTLSDVAENDILNKGQWSRDSRLTLMTFLEDYQTAYALGRIDYLERIFSENALIIVGNKVERKVLKDNIVIKESVKYDTLSKTKYMDRLRKHFNTKEYINLNFTDTDFERASNKKEFYGIRVRQEYFSNNYGDVGWLFLMVDLRFDDPIIHVRAWQNDKLPLEDLFDLSDCY